MPRVITGEAKGARLTAPKGEACRPTADHVKEAVFSILGDGVEGRRWLDVFAGTGQMAIEALSRGAASAVLIERDRAALRAIDANLSKTHLGDRAAVLRGDYRHHLRALAAGAETFDWIYIDPPWSLHGAVAEPLLEQLPRLVASGGTVIVERDRHMPADPAFDEVFTRVRSCQYGICVISFYQLKERF